MIARSLIGRVAEREDTLFSVGRRSLFYGGEDGERRHVAFGAVVSGSVKKDF